MNVIGLAISLIALAVTMAFIAGDIDKRLDALEETTDG